MSTYGDEEGPARQRSVPITFCFLLKIRGGATTPRGLFSLRLFVFPSAPPPMTFSRQTVPLDTFSQYPLVRSWRLKKKIQISCGAPQIISDDYQDLICSPVKIQGRSSRCGDLCSAEHSMVHISPLTFCAAKCSQVKKFHAPKMQKKP